MPTAKTTESHPVLCQNSALLKDHGCNLMHRKVLASFYQHLTAEAPDKLKAKGVEAEFLVLEGEDHAQTALSLGDEDSELFRAVLKMIQAP